jgi:hypothetical protein
MALLADGRPPAAVEDVGPLVLEAFVAADRLFVRPDRPCGR